MNKLYPVLLIIFSFTFFSCFSGVKGEYEKSIINEKSYYFSSNWMELKKSGKPVLFYQTKKIKGETVITDFYYALETNNENIYLGGFELHKGFFNCSKKPLCSSAEESDFIKTKIIGISTKLIDNPFYVIGIAQDKDNKMLYETETLAYFYIDDKNKTIVEWFPKF